MATKPTQKRQKQRILWKFYVSYSVFLILPLVIGIFIYSIGVRIVETDTRLLHHAMLQQSATAVENKLKELETLSVQIVTNPILKQQAFQHTTDAKSIRQLADCIAELSKYTAGKNQPVNCYLFYKNSNYIITPDTLYDAPLYFQQVLHKEEARFSTWQEALNTPMIPGRYLTSEELFGEGSADDFLYYATSIPYNARQEPQATLVVKLPKRELSGSFFYGDERGEAQHFILDAQGKALVLSSNREPDWLEIEHLQTESEWYARTGEKGPKMLLTKYQSSYNQWIFGYLTPEGILFQNLNRFRLYFIVILCVITLAGMLISLFLAYRNAQSVYSVYNKIHQTVEEDAATFSGNAYTVIHKSVNKLLSSNETLQAGIELQRPVMINSFMEKILRGLIYSEEEALLQMEYLNAAPVHTEGLFAVALFCLQPSENQSADFEHFYKNRQRLRWEMERRLHDVYYIHDLDYRSLAVLFNRSTKSTADNAPALRTGLTCFVQELNKQANHPLAEAYTIGVGEFYQNLSELWYSFSQAESCVLAAEAKKLPLLFYADLPAYSEQSYYTIELEQHLLGAAKAGEWETIVQVLGIIYHENFEKRILSKKTTEGLYIQLKNTVYRSRSLLEDETVEDILRGVSSEIAPQKNFQYLTQVYKYLCALIETDQGEQNKAIADRIKQFIEESYMDSGLSLSMAATHFSLSEGYFSSFFKEYIGIPFIDYVGQTRIQKATDLLNDTNLSISEIAFLTGYNSAPSFRRAFKRVAGRNPSSIRR